jgi:hypothetical protein
MSSAPITVDLPHQLGKAAARERIAGGIGKLEQFIPDGAQVESRWEGDRLHLQVGAMGQDILTQIDVFDSHVRLEMVLPPMLAFFGRQIEKILRKEGTELLEDKSKK